VSASPTCQLPLHRRYKTYKISKYIIIKGYIILLRASILKEVKKVKKAIKAKKIKKGRIRKIIILSSLESKEEDNKDKLA
jgi:hypothetical protein